MNKVVTQTRKRPIYSAYKDSGSEWLGEIPEHVVSDFTGVTGNQKNKKAKHLRTIAQGRGWQYKAEQTT